MQNKNKICQTITSSIHLKQSSSIVQDKTEPTPSTSFADEHVETSPEQFRKPNKPSSLSSLAAQGGKKRKCSDNTEENKSTGEVSSVKKICDQITESSLQNDIQSSNVLNNLLNLDRNIKLEFNNCSNFTINMSAKTKD